MKTKKNKSLRIAFLSVFTLTGIVAAGVAIECAQPSPIQVKANIPSGLYDDCEAAVKASSFNSNTLYTALKTAAASGFTSGSYDALWTKYKTTDIRSDGKIKDWYSDDTNFTPGSGQCGTYSSIGDCYNREHSIPKSWWGGATTQQGADVIIVVPTDGKINGMRSNYPFGEVGSSYDSWGKNKLGNGASGSGYTSKVFEPFDSVKGDFARIYFYAVCKWPSVSMTSGEGSAVFQSSTYSSSNNFGLTNYAKNLFYKWHKADPVDDFEINRNDKVQSAQGNRNPFIDHPEYADYLWGGVTPSTKDVESVSVSPTSTSLIYGQTKQLTTTVLPSDAPQTVSYTSSNSNVASVSNSGLITAGNTTGTATITVESTSDATKSATCTVTVSAPSPVSITGVSASNVSVATGSTSTINPTYTPSNAYPIPTYSYVSNNTSIATVSNSGVVTGVSEGSTTIEITASQSGGSSVSTTINVAVTAAPVITSASIVPTDLANAYESDDTEHTSSDGNFKFKTNLCANYSNKIQFKRSSGYLYSSVSSNLKNLTISGGSGTITVYGCNSSGTTGTAITGSNNVYNLSSYKYFCLKNENNSAYTCSKIDIEFGSSPTPVDPTVTLNKTSTTLTVGSTETLTATTTGTGTLSWSSNNNSVATVSNGKITAIAAGSATITASYGGATATCNVTVTSASDPSISLDKSSLSLTVGATSTLHATTSGTGSLTWSSSKTSVATISNGTVTAVSEGSATITASYGGATATCNVTVTSASFVNSIKECYSKSAGVSCSNIYGLYVGSVNGGQSSIIMNGEYGIMLYQKAPESTWVENETYLKVGTSTLDIYNNLYELKSCSNITKITDQSVISANIAPVVTYKVTGSESASDLSIANRLCTVTFKVSSGSVTVGSDSTLTINVNSHTFSLFIKKTEATAALKSFFDAAGTTKTVTAQGYTSFYKTNFQISFKKIIEEEDTYTAEAFAQDLLNLTNETCSYSEQHGWVDVKSTLSPIWLTLEGENYYAKLPAAQKQILVETTGSKTGTTIEIAIDRYDHIVARYGLNNFITGRTVLPLNFSIFTNSELNETIVPLIVVISLISVTALGGYIILKKRKEN